MEMKPVTSSQIEAVGHDPKTNTLHIQFKGGNVYTYNNVSAQHHADMMSAESIGKHFHQHIKFNPSAYPYKKVTK